MKAVAILVVCLFLAGCDFCAKDPIVQTREVKVPVPVKCTIKYPPSPEEPFAELDMGAPLNRKIVASLKELENYRWYSKELKAALSACATNIDETTVVK